MSVKHLIGVTVLAVVLASGCSNLKSQKEASVFTLVLFEGESSCIAVPDTVWARPDDVLAFYTREQSGRVKTLNPYPDPEFEGRYGSGSRLTGRESIEVPPETTVRVRISSDAKGLYRLPVACGRFDDDPPKIIVR